MRKSSKMRGGHIETRLLDDTWSAFTPFERLMLFLGCTFCGFACLWIGQLLGIPREPGFSGSILASGAPVSAVLVVVIAVGICTAIGSVIAAFVEIESGLFCCCIGLAVLGVRCGAIRPVLQYANGPAVFLLMAIETFILSVILFGIWFVLQKLFGQPQSLQDKGAKLAAPNEITDASHSQKLLTLGVQVAVMGVCELILIQSDAKPQAMAGVCVSAFLGVLAAYMFTPLPDGVWYWMGPVALGVIGYVLSFINSGPPTIGDIHGWSAALARPTPLDYAGMGTAGALLAYWCSRRWAQPEETENEQRTSNVELPTSK